MSELEKAKAVVEEIAWKYRSDWTHRDYDEVVDTLAKALQDLIDEVEGDD
jgi:hypothetical protein